MRVGYNTVEGSVIAGIVMHTITAAAHEMSSTIGRNKGCFLNWDKSVYAKDNIPMRNAALTTVAPTGTISMLIGVSGGVEPHFALAYTSKNILGGMDLAYLNPDLVPALMEAGVSATHLAQIMQNVAERKSLQVIPNVPDSVRRVFVTSMDISAQEHIRVQAKMQQHCDNAISKTINFPNKATKKEFEEGLFMAWDAGCKGLTMYRDGSRMIQVLNVVDKDVDGEVNEEEGAAKEMLSSSEKLCQCGGVFIASQGCEVCTLCGAGRCPM
jgi:ribonucleoside-diphosphate reductase alpha chain